MAGLNEEEIAKAREAIGLLSSLVSVGHGSRDAQTTGVTQTGSSSAGSGSSAPVPVPNQRTLTENNQVRL